ncbi:hypothetical protein WG66_010093 [Moniliophthora roreri]|nr:hypothetical protein WG66_010093 [Moniliophthora roreri]
MILLAEGSFSAFTYVKMGGIMYGKDLGSVILSGWNWVWEYEKVAWAHKIKSLREAIHIIEVYPNHQLKFILAAYDGKDAHQTWERNFPQFARAAFVEARNPFSSSSILSPSRQRDPSYERMEDTASTGRSMRLAGRG